MQGAEKRGQKKSSIQTLLYQKSSKILQIGLQFLFTLTKSRNEDSIAKKRFFVVSKNEVKKDIKSKNTFLKVAKN